MFARRRVPGLFAQRFAIGGTTLATDGSNNYVSEAGWSGSGGGISRYQSQPAFQSGVVRKAALSAPSPTSRSTRTPPAAFPSTTAITSEEARLGRPTAEPVCSQQLWAGLIAIADQGRTLNSLSTLDGPSQTLPMLYQLPSSVFHDVTSGNNGFAAGAGYDLTTGIGSPIANLLVPQLAGVTSSASAVAFSVSPSSATAGSSIGSSITVQVLDAQGQVITTDTSNVTLTITTPNGATLSGTTTVAAVNGVATFSGLSIAKAGAYTLTASDGSLSGTSSSFTISAAAASQVVFTHQPAGTTIETAITPSVAVSIEDAFGNIISNDSSTVTLTLSSGTFSTGDTTVLTAAASGVASFSNIIINNAGSYTLTASDGSFTGATSNSFTVAKATPTVMVTDGGGTYSSLAFGATAATAVDPISTWLSRVSETAPVVQLLRWHLDDERAQVLAAMALGGAPSDAGAYTVVATYAGSANYNSATSSPVNFSIARRTLHVAATGQNKTYDGTTAATVTFSDDRVSGDSFIVSQTSATFASKNIGSAIVISVAGINLSSGAASNYTLASSSASTAANITALALTGNITANSKTYDGTTAATLAGMTLTGVIGSEVVTLTGGTATFNSKDVTSATTVTVTGLALSGASAGNYTLSNTTETASATISAFPHRKRHRKQQDL